MNTEKREQLIVEKWNTEIDGEVSEKNMEKKLSRQGYNFIKYTFPPGMDFPDHTHNVSKKDAIVSGRFQFSMYGETVVLEAGDMVEVPKHVVHNAAVVGSARVVFYDSTKD